ncbi:MAG: twin-arginine translocation signal domain-containing protein [Bacteroidota bacterium]
MSKNTQNTRRKFLQQIGSAGLLAAAQSAGEFRGSGKDGRTHHKI